MNCLIQNGFDYIRIFGDRVLVNYGDNNACENCDDLDRWRRRWFALRQSGELPGQYFLDYYADRNCRRLKGTIDLDLCEQVDAGLHMERHGQAPFNPSIRGSVFTIQTQRRTYHLEADCEAEMEKWVDAICRVCGLRATLDVPAGASRHNNVIDHMFSERNDKSGRKRR
uniref:SFRICE_011564 n=1 Tax=Spodoptera frugiperda TaxID=7108 RepID=A0A2H1WMU2_SPOFR